MPISYDEAPSGIRVTILDSKQPEQHELSGPKPQTTWPPQRREVLDWLRDKAPSLADAYEGAARMLEDKSFPGRVHFISHTVRDIADRLVFVLDPQLPPGRVQYEHAMDKIEKLWQGISVTAIGNSAPEPSRVTIEYEVASLVDNLVSDHRARRAGPTSHELLFRHLARSDPSQGDVNVRLVSEFKAIRNWFMERAHLRKGAMPTVSEEELHSHFKAFEGMLHSFVGDFFTGTSELDGILEQANQ